ncbi:hypothetical protein BCR34DRAFT_616090 [Clohesyomyces aquaticus]|uniref:Uncharacterized protein n=1 Tax=Clohesyomyces aquaticus TaxID=1231657 RepID=A0A1Y1ZFH8_9PLEO|nr:hypothetical protein BCR34DRAFT_616090 [Clohesyomyces aquaticus]
MSKTIQNDNFENPWRPGKLRRLPWAGLAFIIGSLCGLAAVILVLVFSNGDPITSWRYRPSVYLAIGYTITNALLAAALAQGATIAWWRRALGEKTTLGDLHNWWAFSGNLKEVLLAGRKTNLVAVAALLVTITPVNGPLFQRASTIRLQNLPSSGYSARLSVAPSIENGTGYLTGRSYTPAFLTPKFEPVVRAFQDGNEIIVPNTGCPADGRCSGGLEGAGFAINCSTTTIPFNASIQFGSNGTFDRPDTGVFSVGFGWSMTQRSRLNFSIIHKNTTACAGELIETNCTLLASTVRYPVVIDGSRSAISLNTNSTMFDDKVVRKPPAELSEGNGESLLSGFHAVLQSRYSSSLFIYDSTPRGWLLRTVNDAFFAQFADYAAVESYGNVENVLLNEACHIRFHDPFDYILNKTRELMFRKAIADGNSTTIQTIPVDVLITTNVYETNFGVMGAAILLTLLAIGAVSTLFYGYWELGRSVSMSPIETAMAFNAPLLRELKCNAKVKQIVKSVGHKAVRYGIVADEESKEESGQTAKDGSTVETSSGPTIRLEIAQREVVQTL